MFALENQTSYLHSFTFERKLVLRVQLLIVDENQVKNIYQ